MLNFSQAIEIHLKVALEKAFPEFMKSDANNSIVSGCFLVPASKPEFGDFQTNLAMILAKPLRKNPREIANIILDNLIKNKDFFTLCELPSIAGPGFINFKINNQSLVAEVQRRLKDSRLGVPLAVNNKDKKVIIDFSSPNIAKEMHVGHLRSTIIGDSLSRIFEFRGYKVLRLNHIGDWGTQFGMLITYLKKVAPEALYKAEAVDLGDLVKFYRQAKCCFDNDANFQKTSRDEVVNLQRGDPVSLRAWELICDQSRIEFEKIYDRLDISLVERGESFYNPFLSNVVEDLEKLGLVVIDEGAKCVFLEGVTNKFGEPLPLIVQKSDGGYNYATTDLAAIRYRFKPIPNGDAASRVIYVTDEGQANHFAGVFQVAKRAGWIPEDSSVEHVPFGLVQGEDGKKLKTRSGETVRLRDLLDQAVLTAETNLRKRLEEEGRNEEESFIRNVTNTIGIAAVKYADLSQNRVTNYQFSFEKMLSLQGNTAPYLLYSLVRIAGIARKGGGLDQMCDSLEFTELQEWNLVKALLKFDEIIVSVETELLPNRLCTYLFELCQSFNRFYDQVPVLKAENPCRIYRLTLCRLTADTLKLGLGLLGIPSLERM